MAAEIETAVAGAQVEIVPEYDGEGNLDIYADNLTVFSSREQGGRFPEEGEIVKILKS
jgi:hypothetical protein